MANYATSALKLSDTYVNTLPYKLCETAASTTAKTVAAGDFSLETGAMVVVKFKNTNSAGNPTLNVSSTGAKAIYYKGAAISAGYLKANYVYTFVYNGTQWDLVGEIDTNTDEKVKVDPTTADSEYKVLLGDTTNTTYTGKAYKNTRLNYNPYDNFLQIGEHIDTEDVFGGSYINTDNAGTGGLIVNGDIIAGGGGSDYGIFPAANCASTIGGAELAWGDAYVSSGHFDSLSVGDLSGGGDGPTVTINGSTGTISAPKLNGYIVAGQKSGSTRGTRATTEGWDTIASGNESHAEGTMTVASGENSHAEGEVTYATAFDAHAEGCQTVAYGLCAHAEGYAGALPTNANLESVDKLYTAFTNVADNTKKFNVAYGSYAHTEGYNNIALAAASHAEGALTIAYAETSHAEGDSTLASGQDSHAEGFGTWAYGGESHAEGNCGIAKGQFSHVEGTSSIRATMFNPAGTLYYDNWRQDPHLAAWGDASHAEGKDTLAYGYAAHSEGNETAAWGIYSHAEGWYNLAHGEKSHVEGAENSAYGAISHVEGSDNTGYSPYIHVEGWCNTDITSDVFAGHLEGMNNRAYQAYSHAEGYGNSVYYNAHAEGNGNIAYGDYSHAEGSNTMSVGTCGHTEGNGVGAYGFYSHAEGFSSYSVESVNLGTDPNDVDYEDAWGYYSDMAYDEAGYATAFQIASGKASHAEGIDNLAYGDASHAEGRHNKVTGDYAHVEGHDCRVTGYTAHAGGYSSVADGICAFAHGRNVVVSGSNSVAFGFGISTVKNNQFVIGHYNNSGKTTAGSTTGTTGDAFIIANGTSTTAANAFRVGYSGTVYSKSTAMTTGADYAEYFEWLDSNPNKEDRRGYFVTMEGEKIKFAEQGDYILGIISGLPAILGNSDDDWCGKYIMDEFGAFVTEEFEYEEEEYNEQTKKHETVKKIGTRYKENPEYDHDREYVQRANRAEWDAVGMLGVLSVRDDGTCQVNGYCTVAEGGIATASETGYRVIKRVNDHLVKVVFR